MPDSLAAEQLPVDAPMTLWAVDLRSDPAPADVALLDAAERARMSRFHFGRDSRRYRAAHVALRALLADASGVAMRDQRFAIGDFGKPALVGRPDLAFNMSYAEDIALVGIGRGRAIGVDVEAERAVDDIESLAHDVFVDSERAALAAEPAGPARHAAFLRGWTRKEACVKAMGTGLSASLDFAVGVADQRTSIIVAEAGRAPLRVGSFSFGNRFICAWAQQL